MVCGYALKERRKGISPLLVRHKPLARRLQFRTQSEKLLHRSDDAFAATLEGVEVVTEAETHQVVTDELGGGQATATLLAELPGPHHEFGGEFFMTFELYHPSGNLAIGYRELPGTATVSDPTYVRVRDWLGDHISCQGPHGVCLVTTLGDGSDGWSALEGELFLQYTDGSVLRLAHHRSSSCGYWVQPRASISRDGRYVVFASNWGRELDCGDWGRGDPYIIDLLADSLRFSVYLPLIVR